MNRRADGECAEGCGEMGVCHPNRDAEVKRLRAELARWRMLALDAGVVE